MRCPTCGFENSGGHRFCGGCGLAVSDTETPELSLQPTLGSGPPSDSPAALAGSESLIADRYQVQRTLGQGGMGAVYLATDTKPGMGGREVAIKRILDADDQGVQRFLRESETIATLNHQNIRAVHDRGEDAEGHYLVMEYIDGETLHDRVAKNGALDDSAFIDLAQGLGKALSFAHKKSVIHRDVKPANVMFTGDGTPKLTDFGLARMGHDSDLSMTGYGMGTLDYASPEQRRDAKSADHRSDVYGLGATLYFAATGESPKTIRESRIPIRWRMVILKCLEEKPEIRYFSIDDFLRDFDQACKGSSTLDATTSSPSPTSPTGTFACPSCNHANPPEKKFCLSCGSGLFLRCPKCDGEEREGTRHCGSCGLDIPAWNEAAEHLKAAHQHLASYAYGRAEKEAKLALEAAPGMDAAKAILKEAHDKRAALKEARRVVQAMEEEGALVESEGAWRAVLELVPDDDAALHALAVLPEKLRASTIHQALEEIEEACSAQDLDAGLESWERLLEHALVTDEAKVDEATERVRELRRSVAQTAFAEVEAHLENKNLRAAKKTHAGIREDCHLGNERLGKDLPLLTMMKDLGERIQGLQRKIDTEQRAARRRNILRKAMAAGVVCVIVAAGLFAWAWRDNTDIFHTAEAQIVAGDFEHVEGTLNRLHGGLVPLDDEHRQRLLDRVDLANNLSAGWPEPSLPSVFLTLLQDMGTPESEILYSFNDSLLSAGWAVVLADPSQWVGALRDPSTDQQATGDALLARFQLSENLNKRWPEPPLPEAIEAHLRDIGKKDEEILGSFNKHLLSKGWDSIPANPSKWVDALSSPTPQQEAAGQALTARYQLSEDLKDRWPEPPLPGSIQAQLRDLGQKDEEVSGSFNEHLLSNGWGLIPANPSKWIVALSSPTPQQEAASQALTHRYQLSEDLKKRWPESSLPEAFQVQLRDQNQGDAAVQASFLQNFLTRIDSSLSNLDLGAWRSRKDSISAIEAIETADNILVLLDQLEVDGAEVSEYREQALTIQTKAEEEREAREAREARERLNPFLAEGWTVEGSTQGLGGHAKKLKDPKTGITFILVEPGEFMMGSPSDEEGRFDDETEHPVELTKPFYLGETEVTQAQWKKLMGASPSKFTGDTLPVEQVSWNDCQDYLENAGKGYRLPTEAEWEYACRAESESRFHSGEPDSRLAAVAWYRDNSNGKTHPIKKKQPNAWGFYDMHGNVWEWCQDWSGDYLGGKEVDPTGPSSGKYRVLRGGSWNGFPGYCRSANRGRLDPGSRISFGGFRVARTLP
jgi:formylglycine-generating enzyme required for sulfatase activity/serine/threonine protein kinase